MIRISWLQTCQNQLTVSLWRFYIPRTNNCLAYSNYSYSGIGPKERALSMYREIDYYWIEFPKPWYICGCMKHCPICIPPDTTPRPKFLTNHVTWFYPYPIIPCASILHNVNQTWPTKWKTIPLAIVQLYEYENQTLEGLACVPRQWPARIFHFLVLRMIAKLAPGEKMCQTSAASWRQCNELTAGNRRGSGAEKYRFRRNWDVVFWENDLSSVQWMFGGTVLLWRSPATIVLSFFEVSYDVNYKNAILYFSRLYRGSGSWISSQYLVLSFCVVLFCVLWIVVQFSEIWKEIKTG